MSNKDVWVERYRPKNINEYVFKNEEYKNIITKWIKNKNLPHLLLSGSPGTGKSSLALMLMRELDVPDGDVLFLNASRERKADDLDSKIVNFASTWPLGDMKYIILDECLDENEEIQMADGSFMRLSEFENDIEYNVLSFNMVSKKIESDIAFVQSKKQDDIYEVELDDGRKIRTTLNHPFLIEDELGNIIEKKLEDINIGDEIVII